MDLLLGNGELQESPLWLYLVEAAPREALMVTSLRVGLRVGRDEALEAFYAHHSKFLAECSRFYIYGEEALDMFEEEALGAPEDVWSVAKRERKPNDWTTRTTLVVPCFSIDGTPMSGLMFGGWKFDANNEFIGSTKNKDGGWVSGADHLLDVEGGIVWMYECSRLLMIYGNTHLQLEEDLDRHFTTSQDERAEVLLELRWINLVRLQEMLFTMKACGDTQHLAKLGCSGGETLGALVQRFIGFGSPTDPTEFMRFYQGPDLNVSFERGPYAVGDVVPSRMWCPHNEMHLPWDFFPSWM